MAKRILMYSTGRTLGHLRRPHNIALAVRAIDPECQILNLVDSPTTPFFDSIPGTDYVKLPSMAFETDFRWFPYTLNLGIEEVVQLRAQIALEVFNAFKPDVILVDFLPVGCLGDLKPVLDQAVRRSQSPKLFLGIRGIIHDPRTTIAEWQSLGVYDYLSHYDAVLVYDRPEIYDTQSAYNLTPYARRVIYCNYVVTAPPNIPMDVAADESFILVMGGSGKDVFPIEQTLVKALPRLSQTLPYQWVILAGPNMAAEEYATLVSQAAPYAAQVYRRVDNATQLIQQAAAVVTMAGYNSLCELLQLRKKALVIPRAGIGALDEQEIRAQLFADLGLVRTLHPTDLTPERLAEELTQLVQADDLPDPANIPPMNGAQRVAQLLLD